MDPQGVGIPETRRTHAVRVGGKDVQTTSTTSSINRFRTTLFVGLHLKRLHPTATSTHLWSYFDVIVNFYYFYIREYQGQSPFG